jgi:hypothetical protein
MVSHKASNVLLLCTLFEIVLKHSLLFNQLCNGRPCRSSLPECGPNKSSVAYRSRVLGSTLTHEPTRNRDTSFACITIATDSTPHPSTPATTLGLGKVCVWQASRCPSVSLCSDAPQYELHLAIESLIRRKNLHYHGLPRLWRSLSCRPNPTTRRTVPHRSGCISSSSSSATTQRWTFKES